MCGLHASDGPVKGAMAAPSVRSPLFAKHAQYSSTTGFWHYEPARPCRRTAQLVVYGTVLRYSTTVQYYGTVYGTVLRYSLRYSTTVQYNWFALTVNRCTTLDGLIHKKTPDGTADPSLWQLNLVQQQTHVASSSSRVGRNHEVDSYWLKSNVENTSTANHCLFFK